MEPEELPVEMLESGAEVLARAFQNDAGTTFFLPDPAQRARALPSMFRPMLRHGKAAGEVYCLNNPLRAVAIWLPPGATTPTEADIERAGIAEEVPYFGEDGLARQNKLVSYLEEVHNRLVPYPHWRLDFLGVDPAYHRQGQGRALITPKLKEIEAQGLPCYLETLEARNVPFYEQNGFRVLEYSVIPGTEVNVWAMLRG